MLHYVKEQISHQVLKQKKLKSYLFYQQLTIINK